MTSLSCGSYSNIEKINFSQRFLVTMCLFSNRQQMTSKCSLFQAPRWRWKLKSHSVKRNAKNARGPPPPFLSRARLIFALHVLIRPNYTIWEPGTDYCNQNVVTDVFTTFWRLLWSITQQPNGNMECICLIQWIEKKKWQNCFIAELYAMVIIVFDVCCCFSGPMKSSVVNAASLYTFVRFQREWSDRVSGLT